MRQQAYDISSTFWRTTNKKDILSSFMGTMKYRSYHRRCSIEKGFLKISQNSQENTSSRVSFLACNFIEKEPLAQLFSCDFYFYKTPPEDCFWHRKGLHTMVLTSLYLLLSPLLNQFLLNIRYISKYLCLYLCHNMLMKKLEKQCLFTKLLLSSELWLQIIFLFYLRCKFSFYMSLLILPEVSY